ncbi:MAG: DUF4476 domain-containing protein [Bacteroidales bacterium]|nr:DUF4476 domain-containing protein [Bacteroidales bacterium]
MKKILIIISLLVISFYLYSQNSTLTVFAQDGEKFWLVLNGVKQNNEPVYRVENIQINTDYAKMKILFENSDLSSLDKHFPAKDADGNYCTFTYNIKKNKKGIYVVRMVSFEKITSTTQTSSNVVSDNTSSTGTTTSTTGTTTIKGTTTQSSITNQGKSDNLGVSINANESGVSMNITGTDGQENVNMNMNLNMNNANVTSSTTTTVTTSTTTTSSSGNYNQQNQEVVYVSGYNGPVGCPIPMSEYDFNSAKSSISSKDFEDSKLTMAKQIVGSNCLLASQVKEIMRIFEYEDTRLEFAKYAYKRTYDKGNYYKVNDAFEFELTIDELNEFIENH